MVRKEKRKRTARQKSSGVLVLTPRDLDILALLGAVGYASTAQVARDLFPSENRARRRLRELFDAGYVSVSTASSQAPNILSLTPVGRSALLQVAGDVPAQLAGPVRLLGLQHHLAVVDVRLWLSALAAAGEISDFSWSGGRSERAAELGVTAAGLVPDGICEFSAGGEDQLLAVEVDCGSESAGELSGKLARYGRLWQRLPELQLLVVAAGAPGGAGRLVRLVHGAGLAGAAVVEVEHVVRRPALSLPWPAGRGRSSCAPEYAHDERAPAPRAISLLDRLRAVHLSGADSTADGPLDRRGRR